MNRLSAVLAALLLMIAIAACSTYPNLSGRPNPVVGTWIVNDVDAPLPCQMYAFNGDGTLQQANPDAGDPNSSDSDGKGIWMIDGDRIKGEWVEVTADRATHKATGRAEISCDFRVDHDAFPGTAAARSYDASGILANGPTSPARFDGKRITYP